MMLLNKMEKKVAKKTEGYENANNVKTKHEVEEETLGSVVSSRDFWYY